MFSIATMMNSARKFFATISLPQQAMETFDNSTEPNTQEPWTSSQAVFRASLFPTPDKEEEKMMTASSGLKCLELYGRYLPNGSLLKTCVASLLKGAVWYSSASALRWRVLGTKYSRLLFQLVPLTLPTEETEFGLLPTPTLGGFDDTNESVEQGPTACRGGAANGHPADANGRGFKGEGMAVERKPHEENAVIRDAREDSEHSDDPRLQRHARHGNGAQGRKEQDGYSIPPSWREHWHEAATRLCGVDDGFSAGLDGITVPSWRTQSLKAYGNAIVPQVAYAIFQSIAQVE